MQLYHEHWKGVLRYNIVKVILSSLFLFSCDILSTRNPEEPIIDTNSNPPATTPQLVISNFIAAFQNKNILEYEKLISDTTQNGRLYKFNPTTAAKIRYSTLFQQWNKISEKQFITKLFTSLKSPSSPSLTLSNSRYEYIYADSALYSSNYQINVEHLITSIPTQFKGKFYLTLNKNNVNIWSISLCEDFETSKDSSFSDCKGAFSN